MDFSAEASSRSTKRLLTVFFAAPAACWCARIGYLEKPEMDALLNAPDRRTAMGARDYALLLFLYNSGARADEVAKLTIGRLNLSEPASVRILGKGNKLRMCPLWPVTMSVLAKLVAGRHSNETVFRGRTSEPMTRFGIHRVVAHYGALVSKSIPIIMSIGRCVLLTYSTPTV